MENWTKPNIIMTQVTATYVTLQLLRFTHHNNYMQPSCTLIVVLFCQNTKLIQNGDSIPHGI